MTILHVITRLILGGAQLNTVMSCRAQVAAGHEVHLAYGPIFGPEGSLLEEARASGATLHEVGSLVRELSPRKDVRCVGELRRLVRELRPDVVHSHSSKAGILTRAAAWRETQRAGFWAYAADMTLGDERIVHTVHGLPWDDTQAWWRRRLYVGLERWAAKRCHHVVAITPQMVDAFVDAKVAPREKFTVIPSGVEVADFAPVPRQRDAVRARYGIPADAAVVGHVGRLDRLKGHADLLDVLPQLDAGGRDVWLLFVGDGFDRAAVEARPQFASGRAVITGRVDADAVPAHLAAMDVTALPSYQEGQSRTLVEALLCETPVVGYATGGIPDVVRDGVTGRLAATGDRDALAAALNATLADPAGSRAMAAAGRADVAERFSAERMNRELLTLYGRLVRDVPAD